MKEQSTQPAQATEDHAAKPQAKPEAKGVAMVEQMMKHAPPDQQPTLLAEIITNYPADEHAIAHWVNANIGMGTFQKAKALARTSGIKAADKRNLVMSHEQPNSHDRDVMSNGTTPDPNRLTDDGKPARVATDTPVYDDTGRPTYHLKGKSDIKINAGAYTKLPLPPDGKLQACVYVYGDTGMGWIPVSCLTHDSKKAHGIVDEDHHLATKMEGHQKEGMKFEDAAHVVTPVAVPANLKNLMTMANQNLGENQADHYFMRHDGAVNLCFNVPGTGNARFGIASDRVGPGAVFHRAEGVPELHTPLYPVSSKEQTGDYLTFVYGKIIGAAGKDEPQYGWITVQQVGLG